MAITKNDFVKYTVLPGIVPRISGFLSSGFAFLASLVAVIYYNVGLLPAGHTYLKPESVGRYGLRHVIAEAGKNLTFERKHIDQIVIYFTILLGLALIGVQIVLLGISLLASPVLATTPWEDIFVNTPHGPSQDIAFIVLDNVFGMKQGSGSSLAAGFYNSCISDLGTDCLDMQGKIIPSPTSYPEPMHLALHSLLHFYTMGIAMISGVILIYFIVTIVGETVTTGIPFGQRLNRAWFIPRLIVFFALLAPVSTVNNNAGINMAQLIVFSVAKFGSNMATNAWLQFNDASITATSKFLGEDQGLLAEPNLPDIGGLTQFMHIVRMCIVAEKIVNGIDIYPYFVRAHDSDATSSVLLHDGTSSVGGPANMGGTTNDYLWIDDAPAFVDAVIFSRYKTVVLRFGHRNPPGTPLNPSGVLSAPADSNLLPNNKPDAYEGEWGYIQPTCGELHFDITSLDKFVIDANGIQNEFFLEISDFFYGNNMASVTVLCMAQSILPYGHDPGCVDDSYSEVAPFGFTSDTKWITAEAARANIEFFSSSNNFFLNNINYDWGTRTVLVGASVFDNIRNEYDIATYTNTLVMPLSIRQRGWAGAAMWYNKIAELNGIVTSAVKNIPKPFRYPMVMETVAAAHIASDTNLSNGDRFNPRLQNGQLVALPRPGDQYIAAVLYNDYNFWRTSKVQETVATRSTKNSIIDFINVAFGTEGLLNLMANKGTHPLAMLSSAGKGIVDASINNLFLALGMGLGGMISDDFFGNLGKTGGEFLVQMSLLTLSIGFMLYYVLPFLPFIYFFFAFAGWIKSIFEAVVAMPLWAIAHIKIDGEGLPGPWATNGYFLIFEIFLRPILIIFGFLASISLFSALVTTLHDVFHVLTLSATGYDLKKEIFDTTILSTGVDSMDYWRSPVDELFYTVVYVIIVYMIGLSCFKLIDQIPNNIMRWMGVTVSTFHETAGDPAGELSGKMYRATQMTNAQITTSIARMQGTATAQTEANVTNTQILLGS